MKNQQLSRGTNGSRGRFLGALGLCAWALAGCSGLQAEEPAEPMATPESDSIKVFYEGDCPRFVDNQLPSLEQGKGGKLVWTAYDVNDPSKVKEDAYFEVYFDPFTGGNVAKAIKGVATSQPLSGKLAKDLLFKYSIVATEQNGKPLANCTPVDPFFRIR